MEGLFSSRAVLSVIGEDATTFLQGLVTQEVRSADAIFTALLTPQGKILFDFFLVPVDGGYLFDCDAAAAPALLKRLSMYKLRAKIVLAHEAGLAVFAGAAPGARAAYGDPRLPLLPVRTMATRLHPGEPRSGVTNDATEATGAYDALRLSLGVPEFGRDFVGEEVFLLDVNYDALGAVSYKKGCFVGQEVTSRMKRKGEVRKRTLVVRGPALGAGESVMAGDLSLGEVLSFRGPAGLALIRVDRLAEARSAGVQPTVAGAAVTVEQPDYLGGA